MLNELITNAAKHGAVARELARVEVELSDHDAQLSLVVRDHGQGFPAQSEAGIGTEVVDQLVSQNQGTIRRTSENGAVVQVEFPYSVVMREEPVRVRQEQLA
ncbi:MAG: ATP-binding protein [bacterium]